MLVKYIVYFLSRDRDATENTPTKRFSVAAYNKVIKKILNMCKIESNMRKSDIQKIELTKYMSEKITSYFSKKIPIAAKKPILKLTLANIIGIGPKKADILIGMGLKSIHQLTLKKYQHILNNDAKIMTKYKPVKKIPHIVIKKIEPILTKFPSTFLVGSFRRKKSFSSDIDVMVVSSAKNVLEKYIKHLAKNFTIVPYQQGIDKISLLIKYDNIYLKLDAFRTLPKSKYAMILYSTGSKYFNIKMRSIAKKQGYLLNQIGLFKDGKKIPIRSERGFFIKLKMEYVEPHNR